MVGYNTKYKKEMGDFNLDNYYNDLKGYEINKMKIVIGGENPLPSLYIEEKGIIYLSSLDESIHETEYDYMIELIGRIESIFRKLITKESPSFLKIERAQADYYFLVNHVRSNAPDLSFVENGLGRKMIIIDES